MIEIVLPRHLATDYGSRIEAVAAGRARLVPVRGGDRGDPDLGTAEIAVDGAFDGPATFPEILAAMPRLRWAHSLAAGIDGIVSPALAAARHPPDQQRRRVRPGTRGVRARGDGDAGPRHAGLAA